MNTYIQTTTREDRQHGDFDSTGLKPSAGLISGFANRRTKAFYLREVIERGLEDMRTTTLPQTCWSASVKARRKCTRPPT